jgi:riboflavin synthase
MFTGIVAEVGMIVSSAPAAAGTRLEIQCAHILERLAPGDSVNVNGACLTVLARESRSFAVELVPETLARTTLGRLREGDQVNLEAAATPERALAGHIVQGHIDGTTALEARVSEGAGARLRFALPAALARYVVEKGFVALDGVSLTVASLSDSGFEVALIPYTAARTTLGRLREGDLVNIEVDIIGKYVERLLDARAR